MKLLIRVWTVCLVALGGTQCILGQLDSIFDQGAWRTYILHLPAGYSEDQEYPLVLNLHGLNSDAAQQQAYSQFDAVADVLGFIVVYPNGVSNSWAVGGDTDVNFIHHLVTVIRESYSCNNCLFSTGISDGGFMTYKLACALPDPLTAVAVVSGNMAKSLQNNCALATGLPVMHFHGTADMVVNFNGVPPFIPPVDSTLQWWVDHNMCNPTPEITEIPDINMSDECTVAQYVYDQGIDNSEMTFYRIENGGHTWPGATPVPPLGNTDQDISASEIIGAFFQQYCAKPSALSAVSDHTELRPFPNPADVEFAMQITGVGNLEIFNSVGLLLCTMTGISGNLSVPIDFLPDGLYYVKVTVNAQAHTARLLVLH